MSARGGLRDALVAAALAILEAGGAELSLRGAARAAGVSAMAPYRHFADKAALLAAVAGQGFAELHAALSTADRVAEPQAALLAQGVAYLAFARARPALFRLMFAGPLPAAAGAAGVKADAFGVLSRRVAELVPGDAEAAALACWSMVHGLATLALDGRLDGADLALERRALALFLGGLAARA